MLTLQVGVAIISTEQHVNQGRYLHNNHIDTKF